MHICMLIRKKLMFMGDGIAQFDEWDGWEPADMGSFGI